MFVHILNLIRVKDWLKNLLIFIPLIFSDNLNRSEYYLDLFFTFFLFSLVCSVIYIVNDIADIETDKLHPIKKNVKPLANGSLSIFFAKILIVLLVILIILFLLHDSTILLYVLCYLILNLAYNYYLKKIPIFDVLVISIGYILRIESGSEIVEVTTSFLMLCSIFFLSTFILSIKRKKEFENNFLTRKSLKFYNLNSIRYSSYLSCFITFCFYLFYIATKNPSLIITAPVVLFVFWRYLYLDSRQGKGEFPIDTVIYDWQLLVSCILYIIIVLYNFL
jgi:4-hydroxybenzoate polyprenyltransferase